MTYDKFIEKYKNKASREDKINAVLALQGLNKARVAKEMGVSRAFVDQLFNGKSKTPSRLQQLVIEFNIPPELLP